MLFDLEMSGSSCKNIYNSSIGVQSDEIDLSDVLSGMQIHQSNFCFSLHDLLNCKNPIQYCFQSVCIALLYSVVENSLIA